jgi:hypothetical protein
VHLQPVVVRRGGLGRRCCCSVVVGVVGVVGVVVLRGGGGEVVGVGFFVTGGSGGVVVVFVLLGREERGAVARRLDAVRDGVVLGVGDFAAEEDGARDLEADDARVGVRAEARGGARQAGERVVAGEERGELGEGGLEAVADVDDLGGWLVVVVMVVVVVVGKG